MDAALAFELALCYDGSRENPNVEAASWWRLSRARAARAEKPAAPDPPATAPDPATAPPAADPGLSEKFAQQAHDLDARRKTVEDAAAVSAGFWLSYLFVLFYIAIAAGAVTHRDLLLENPVKLPFLNDVPLPLIAFFFLAPIVFITRMPIHLCIS